MGIKRARIVGAGLAGSEAAWQLAQRGWSVELWEMRPAIQTPAHTTGDAAELVCSNSFRGNEITQAPGVLKRELERAESMIMRAAHRARIPAGSAFAVDRQHLSQEVESALAACPTLERRHGRIERIDDDIPTILATGPLTAEPLARWLAQITGTLHLAFYDAIAPILDRSSLDESAGWWGNRRDPDGHDYFNIPLDRPQYEAFVSELQRAERVAYESFETDIVHFEGCLPIEVMADRGLETLRFGPMKAVGLDDPRTGRWPHAVVQLRQENAAASMLNFVGFQTKMKHAEQVRVLRTLPGLAQAEFVRLGSMHRNTFVRSPQVLDARLRLRARPAVWIAGQLSGVEGYVESTASGLMAALSLHEGEFFELPPATTAIGSLLRYITDPRVTQFQPMNTNFGLFAPLTDPKQIRAQGRARKQHYGERALRDFEAWAKGRNLAPWGGAETETTR